MKLITKNSEETEFIGREFVDKIKAGEILLLYGDLGAGKTTFVQGFAKGLGIKDRILSPTFVLQRIHEVKKGKIRTLNHIDLYRIEKPTEIENLGLGEIFDEEESVTVIEWADRIKDSDLKKSLPAGRQGYKIYFKYLGDNQRELVVKKYERA